MTIYETVIKRTERLFTQCSQSGDELLLEDHLLLFDERLLTIVDAARAPKFRNDLTNASENTTHVTVRTKSTHINRIEYATS